MHPPIVGALPVAAAPIAVPAPSNVDPICALIDEYRAAAKAVAAGAAEVSRREEMLLEQGLGAYAFISVLDTRGPGKPAPTMVYSHDYIDRFLPPDRFSKADAEARASLDTQIERHKAIMGDSKNALNAAQDSEIEALDTLVWTKPTTIRGVLALLELSSELHRSRAVDDDQAHAITISVIDALQDLHPST